MRWIFLSMLLMACGHTELTPDSGAAESIERVTLPSTARDAGDGKWCAPEGQPCLVNGWEYDLTGHCCLARQTCKGRDGGYGYCEY